MPKKKAKTPVKAAKKNVQTKTKTTDTGPRRFQIPTQHWYMPWRRRFLPIPKRKPLPKARTLFRTSISSLRAHWKFFGGIVAIYGIVEILLVRGLSADVDLSSIKATFLNSGNTNIESTFRSLPYLFSSSGSNSAATSGVYQTFLLLFGSLAFIWALRQTTAKREPRVRDSFYLGMYPLVPFILVLLVIGLQLLPLVFGGSLYASVITNGIAIHAYERFFFLVIFILSALASFYMITSSIFALYIVTLPDMTPIKALRSARQIVFKRRLLIWRKLIFLPVMLLIIGTLVELPLLLFAPPIATWVFFVLSMAALALVHSYLYGLYRDLLDEE